MSASESSFDMLSSRSRSSTSSSAPVHVDNEESDDDVILWGVSSSDESSSSVDLASDDDFVVLSPPLSPTTAARPHLPLQLTCIDTTAATLASNLARLSVNEVSSTIRRKKAAAANVHAGGAAKQQQVAEGSTSAPSSPKGRNRRRKNKSAHASPAHSQPPSPAPATPVEERPASVATLTGKPLSRRRRKAAAAAAAKSGTQSPRGLGARPIVDDVSELPDNVSERDDSEPALSMYDAAASYINAFLADKSSVGRLTLLQSLIIELGLATASLPASLTAAKATLKSHAFLNIGEYLAVREQGPAAVQSVMYKSRASLIRDIRRKRNPTSLRWVKDAGLQVLLVSCHY